MKTHSPRGRSAPVLVSLLALTAALLVRSPGAGAATAASSVAITDPAGDTLKGDPATAVDAPKADITAASARYQNDHITFTMSLREGDDLSNPDSLLWWAIGDDNACCAFVSLRKGSDGLIHVLMGEPGTAPALGDTSQDCPGGGASLDASRGTYIASIPASCLSPDPMASFQWQAGRRVPTGAGEDIASDLAPDIELAASVTNTTVTGYWAIGSDGKVYPFGEPVPTKFGEPASASLAIVDIEAAPHGTGYWTVDSKGVVTAFGPVHYGNVSDLRAGERVTSISGTPTGAGYWIFTSTGRVVAFGDADTNIGDVATLDLNGEILDSAPTPTGKGYYLVGSDGGVFALGDAHFEGSMGDTRLNQPVQSIVPDPDGTGYWLVASDGGVFAFKAAFRGSTGSIILNKPMTGMVPYGNGYLMVAQDGGVFNFSDQPFSGSLGDNPPANAIVSITALS